jgi:hypothetical protein
MRGRHQGWCRDSSRATTCRGLLGMLRTPHNCASGVARIKSPTCRQGPEKRLQVRACCACCEKPWHCLQNLISLSWHIHRVHGVQLVLQNLQLRLGGKLQCSDLHPDRDGLLLYSQRLRSWEGGLVAVYGALQPEAVAIDRRTPLWRQ